MTAAMRSIASFNARYDWLVDNSPTGNIHRRDVVCESRETAGHTGETRLTETIAFIDAATFGASAAGVLGIDQDHRHTRTPRLVRDKRAQLKEGPTMQRGSLAATNRNPLANPTQVFEGNRSLCVFRLRHKLLADAMVGIFRKTSFLARKFLQFALGRPRALGLQLGAQSAVVAAHGVDMAGRVEVSIRVNSNVLYTQVHTQHTIYLNRLSLCHFNRGREKERTVCQYQIRFAFPRLQQLLLSFPTYKRNSQPPLNCPDRHRRVRQSPRQDAIIVSNTACRPKRAWGVFVQLVSIRHFGNDTNSDLRRQAKVSSDSLVAQVMQAIAFEGLGLPSLLTDIVARSIGTLQRAFERVSLFGSGQKFDLGYQLHTHSIAQMCQPVKLNLASSAIPNLKLDSGKMALLTGFCGIYTGYFWHNLCFLLSNSRNRRILGLLGFRFGIAVASLTFFNIPLDAFCADVTGGTNIIAFGPQSRIFAPIVTTKHQKFSLEVSGCDAFEQAHDLGRRVLGRSRHEQVHMVRHDFNCQDFKIVSGSNLIQQHLQTLSNRFHQHFFAIARNPN